ncbi:Histone-lysine N-methyltransferase SUV39H2 [Tetrabaena socialis]|uniref:Histone-lysine N-methyltransferase SUV39H2 n=1 Tax=Tetrabaena socialis TaxID=47790 RepID=A0A2J8A4E6_9CHLO|nr:Histone-lysine N-methyltransferase SUV39H2 [Tetrabaena socialis]|eukprot:PNH07386.1 Histone-lysine N-methyltransferase SUV39H2 [Tetrabaena socialis]
MTPELSFALHRQANKRPRCCAAGEPFTEVPWSLGTGQPHPPPHLVLVESGSRLSQTAARTLHAHCVGRSVALRARTSLSTPWLDWAVVLVPSALPRTVQQPGAVLCFFAYFLPGNESLGSGAGEGSGGNDLPYDTTRPPPRARKPRLCTGDGDLAINRWRQHRGLSLPDPDTGLPAVERNVYFSGYWDRTQSEFACFSSWAQERRALGAHVGSVPSVMPGRRFHYVTRPLRCTGGKGQELEEVSYDLLDSYLEPCPCGDRGEGADAGGEDGGGGQSTCGGLSAYSCAFAFAFACACALRLHLLPPSSARRALRALRAEGVPYALEIRMDSSGQGLAVYPLEDIPQGVDLAEYVGEELRDSQAERRERRYEERGLHYTSTLPHANKLRPEAAAAAPSVIDATHVGNLTRFINHSCEGACLEAVNVCAGGTDEVHMSVLFRTIAPISRGQELTINYYGRQTERQKAFIRAQEDGLMACRCGAAGCLRWLWVKAPTEEELIRMETLAAETQDARVAAQTPEAAQVAEVERATAAAQRPALQGRPYNGEATPLPASPPAAPPSAEPAQHRRKRRPSRVSPGPGRARARHAVPGRSAGTAWHGLGSTATGMTAAGRAAGPANRGGSAARSVATTSCSAGSDGDSSGGSGYMPQRQRGRARPPRRVLSAAADLADRG